MFQPNTQRSFRKYLILLGIAVLSGLFPGCEKDPEALTTNSAITGHVALNNLNPVEPSGIKVVASGPYGHSTSSTDGYGNFVIGGLGNGTYYLDYSKKGYGSVRQYNIQLFGGDTVRAFDVILFEKPGDFEMPELTKAYVKKIPYGEAFGDYIWIETDVNTYFDYQIIFYMSDRNDVSWNRYTFSVRAWPRMLSLQPEILAFEFQNYGLPFESGTTVYLRAFPCNISEWQSGGYVDIYHGTAILSTLDKSRASNVISFIMP
jgi:hypothetical protein